MRAWGCTSAPRATLNQGALPTRVRTVGSAPKETANSTRARVPLAMTVGTARWTWMSVHRRLAAMAASAPTKLGLIAAIAMRPSSAAQNAACDEATLLGRGK